MHEFSLAVNVLEIVEEAMKNHNASRVTEVVLDIGALAGVEIEAFSTAIDQIKHGTILEESNIVLNIIEATAVCRQCQYQFSPIQKFDLCPNCKNFNIEITSGKELTVRTIVAE